MTVEEFFFMVLAWIVGSVVSGVILGFMADRFIIRKIMGNEEVKDFIQVFREAKEYLKKILENQKEAQNEAKG